MGKREVVHILTMERSQGLFSVYFEYLMTVYLFMFLNELASM